MRVDLPGYEPPPTIGRVSPKRPDIYATKRGHVRIIEVETPDTVGAHQDQHEVFRRSVAQRNNAKFVLEVTGD